ncbi:MAG TPA: oligosaccharide flippase family protein [Pyrinomonadaceae bacterium]
MFASRVRTFSPYKNLFRGGAGTLALRIIATALTLILSAVVARIVGAAGYGAYAYALTLVNLLAILACLGTDRLLVRLVATYHEQEQWGLIRGILRWSNLRALAGSVLLAVIAAVVCYLSSAYSSQVARHTFLVSLLLLPLLALTTLRLSALQGIHYVLRGQLPETIFRPVLMLGLLAFIYFAFGRNLSAPVAAGVNAVATGLAFLIGAKLLRDVLPPGIKTSSPQYREAEWMQHALPLLLIHLLWVVSTNIDTIILGAIKGTEAVGFYTVANRGADLISFALVALNAPLSPMFARLWVRGDVQELQRVARLAAYVSLLLSLPVALTLIIHGSWFMTLFGLPFPQAKTVFMILSAGHIVNAMIGLVGLLLIMSGHEREAARGFVVSIIIQSLLCVLLIQPWGVIGAAVARSCGLLAWNLLLLRTVYNKLSINPTVFGKFNHTGNKGS